jgi:hypothetical protein
MDFPVDLYPVVIRAERTGHNDQRNGKIIVTRAEGEVNSNIYHPQIDWEESNNSGRVCVRLNVDSELDEWKHIYHGLDSVLVRLTQISHIPLIQSSYISS